MKIQDLFPAIALAAAIGFGGFGALRAATFTPGNLAVLRVGDGSVAPLANNATNVFIEEYTPGGGLAQTIAIPASGADALVLSGSATSEGSLTRSANGRWLCFGGYNTNAGLTGIATNTAAAAPRVLAVVDASGTYALVASSTIFNSANNLRSATSDGTNNFWGCGTAGSGQPAGVNYFGVASPTNAVYSGNLRVLQLINGDLYFSSGAASPGVGIHKITGAPVSSATPAAPSPLIVATASPYGFAINSAGNIAYVADDGAGGLRRFTNSSGTWSLDYLVNATSSRGLVVDWSGVNPILYATTTTNSIIAVTDTGASSAATLIVSGATGTAFRGIALAPLAAPSISSQPQSLAVSATSNASFSVTASGYGSLTYQWRKNGADIGGQTASTLSLNNVQGADAGNYDVIVANSVFAVTSSVATLTVNYVINIAVTNRIYSAYRTDLAADAWVYVDADPAAGSPVRATQRCLGYREVDYKSQVPGTLGFTPVTPTTNGNTVTYDYSGQTAKTTTVGFWVDKNVPIIIGPDGNAYITDGHHTTAGLIAPISPIRQLVPGKNRVILGHIVANYYNPMSPQAPDDTWWTSRQSENNALLYGPDGDQLTLSGEPNYSSLQPILPSVLVMPTTPSTLTTNGAVAMTPSTYRALTWGLADAIVVSATDSANKKIVGYKKSAPGSSVDINFVEFFWADYLRHRIVWDDTLTGSPYGSTNGDASVIAAPHSFFTAVANGIALARSQAYLDEYGRNLTNYTNGATFTANTVNWANGSLSNGLAAATDTYHLYLRDDSSIAGTISPSPLSTNILHIDTVAGMTVTQTLQNIRSILVNAGGTLNTSWKDATVSNSTLRLPAGTGVVKFETTLQGAISVASGTFGGSGTVNGSLTIQTGGTLAPGASIGTMTVNGPLTLSGATTMEINKTGMTLSSDLVTGITTLTYGGSLMIVATGDTLAAGDSFNLFDATTYVSAFGSLNLPSLDPGLTWDTSQLIVDGTLRVVSGSVALAIATQPQSQTANVGATVTLTSGAVGSAPITNQWRLNGNDIGGQTGSSLTLANIQEASQGQYTFVAQNAAGAITSSVATVTVNQAPTAQAQSVSLAWNSSIGITLTGGDLDGDTLSFTVTVQPTHGILSGSAPNLTYTPTANYSGPDSFTFRVSDGALTATAIVSITVQPGFTYKDTDLLLVFRKDGASDVLFNLGNVSNYINQSQGAMNNISFNTNLVLATYGGSYTGVKYVLMAVTPLDSSPLRAWLSDADGSGAPRDETFSRWGGQRSKISQIGGGATQYFNSSNQSLVLPSSDPGSYSFIASDAGSLDISTMGGTSPFPVEQDVPGHLRLIELKVSTAIPKPLATQAGSFDLSLTGGGSLKFTAGVTAPVFTAQPSNQTGECGGSATFSSAASGDGPVTFQWYAGASPIGGATDSSVTLSPLTLGSGGSYSVVASNAGGATASSMAMLTVADTTPPALSLPSNLTATRDSAGGKVVTFSASASDVCAGSVAVNCTPASGSTFPMGVTTVNCSANDGNGNTANGSFTVTVILGFTYKDTDLLLVFRKDGASDVLFNLGNVSNYINQSQGVMNNISFDTNLVLATYGGSYTGVKYVLMAVTPLDSSPLRAWLSDVDGSGAPRDETFSRWGGQRSKISQIGGGATQYFNSSNQSLVLPSSDPGSYSYIASDAGSLDISTMGGTSPFPVEQDVPGHLRLIELKVSTAIPKPLATQAGSFDLSLTGGGSLKFTAGVTAPVFTAQPSNQTGECGGSATFSAVASGDGPVTYQWYAGASAIGGATDSSVTLSPLTLGSGGSYSVVASNAGGATASSMAMLTVADTTPPVLSLPSNLTATRDSAGGKVVTFSASASDVCAGSVAVNCTPASGSTFPLGVTTVNCSANDGNGNTANGSFTVTVILGFTYKDTDLLLVFRKDGGSDVLFNLGNVSNYINQSQGAMNNISFDTNLVLATYGGSYTGVKYVLMAVTPLDSSPLRAWLSDADGSGAPRDETFSRWGGQRSKISQIGGGATQYFNSSNQSLVLPSSDPGSYSYIASDAGSLDISTMGGTSPFPVEQDVPGHLRLIELKVSTAIPKPLATQAGSFDLSLTGGGSLKFTAGVTAPVFTAQPSNQTGECGSSATFSAVASGDGPVTYQWYAGASAIGGATDSSVTLSPLTLGSGGSYSVVASNAGGATASSMAMLTVADTTPPVLSLPSNLTATRDSAGGKVVTFSASASDVCAGSVAVNCTPASGSTFPLGVTTVNCSANDGNGNTANGSFTVTVILGFTYKDTDLLLVFRKDGGSDVLFNLGNVSNYINQSQGAMNNISFDTNLVLATYGGSYTGVKYVLMAVTPLDSSPLRAWLSDADGSGAPRDETFSRWGGQRSKISQIGGGATQYFNSSNQSLVLPSSDPGSYSYIASDAGSLDISTMGGTSPFPVEQDVPGHLRLIELKVSTAIPKPLATQAGSFDLTLGGGGSANLKFTAGVTAPVITSQPASLLAVCGASATFSVSATGDGPLSYQWYRGATPVSGATDGTLVIYPVVAASAGSYTVVVGNAGGTTTSSAATLAATEPAVALAVSKFGTNVVLAWPQTCVTYTLEGTLELTPPASSWVPVGVTPTAGGGQWMVTLPTSATNAFFRLRYP